MAMVVKKTASQKVFDVLNHTFLLLLVLLTLYPCIYVVVASLSDPNEVLKSGGYLPMDIKNPKTDEDFSQLTKVCVEKIGETEYSYSVEEAE